MLHNAFFTTYQLKLFETKSKHYSTKNPISNSKQ